MFNYSLCFDLIDARDSRHNARRNTEVEPDACETEKTLRGPELPVRRVPNEGNS